jgi:hypothetical protein
MQQYFFSQRKSEQNVSLKVLLLGIGIGSANLDPVNIDILSPEEGFRLQTPPPPPPEHLTLTPNPTLLCYEAAIFADS